MRRVRERDRQQDLLERIIHRFSYLLGPRKRPGEGGEGVPVVPNRPNHLSGGAAAELDFGA